MNNKCNKESCMYKETCLIVEDKKIKKCTGIVSIKNPHHEDYSAIAKQTN